MTDNLFKSNPAVLRALEATTGLSEDDIESLLDGLSAAGLSPALHRSADSEARSR